MAKSVKLKDRNNNQILPITRATTVEMNDGSNMQEKLDSIEDNILEVNYNSGNTALVFGSSSVKYMITLTGNDINVISDITVNGESKTTSDFPLEVDEGSSLYFVNLSALYGVSVTMGGELITTVVHSDFQLANITGDVVLNIFNGGGGND